MYCVIQEIETKKLNTHGYSKELKSEYVKISIMGKDESHYYYSFSDERFDRPVRKAYRISIHQSFRERGKVKKKQLVLCTVNYYDLATDYFTVYDWCDGKINIVADALAVSVDKIYELVQGKVEPLRKQVQAEFHETQEYQTHKEHEQIIESYRKEKKKFAKKYGVGDGEYDKIFDVFSVCRNPEYLKKLQEECEWRKEYEKGSSSYYKNFYGNYTGGSYKPAAAYSEDDKETLKQFYRELSKRFHPDSNPNMDTSKQMKLLNQLKNEWGL